LLVSVFIFGCARSLLKICFLATSAADASSSSLGLPYPPLQRRSGFFKEKGCLTLLLVPSPLLWSPRLDRPFCSSPTARLALLFAPFLRYPFFLCLRELNFLSNYSEEVLALVRDEFSFSSFFPPVHTLQPPATVTTCSISRFRCSFAGASMLLFLSAGFRLR